MLDRRIVVALVSFNSSLIAYRQVSTQKTPPNNAEQVELATKHTCSRIGGKNQSANLRRDLHDCNHTPEINYWIVSLCRRKNEKVRCFAWLNFGFVSRLISVRGNWPEWNNFKRYGQVISRFLLCGVRQRLWASKFFATFVLYSVVRVMEISDTGFWTSVIL